MASILDFREYFYVCTYVLFNRFLTKINSITQPLPFLWPVPPKSPTCLHPTLLHSVIDSLFFPSYCYTYVLEVPKYQESGFAVCEYMILGLIILYWTTNRDSITGRALFSLLQESSVACSSLRGGGDLLLFVPFHISTPDDVAIVQVLLMQKSLRSFSWQSSWYSSSYNRPTPLHNVPWAKKWKTWVHLCGEGFKLYPFLHSHSDTVLLWNVKLLKVERKRENFEWSYLFILYWDRINYK